MTLNCMLTMQLASSLIFWLCVKVAEAHGLESRINAFPFVMTAVLCYIIWTDWPTTVSQKRILD